MSLLVRKIEKAKWNQKHVLDGEIPSADAITNCMKTRGNTLSVWRIESQAELDDVVVAIVSGGQHLDTIDVVLIPEELALNNKVEVIPSDGCTPYTLFVERHRDFAELDYSSLGIVSDMIIGALRDEKCFRYTKGRLKKLLLQAVKDSKVDIESLDAKLGNKIKEAIAK